MVLAVPQKELGVQCTNKHVQLYIKNDTLREY